MSRPHSTKELLFAPHPTKPFTYVPGRRKVDRFLGWCVVALGTAVLGYATFLITRSL